MGMTDPISDMLTRIRNAQMVRQESVKIPASKIKIRISEILKDEGFIESSAVSEDAKGFKTLRLGLKYHEGRPVIEELKRISRPGSRRYVGKNDIPRVYQGLGIAILSTSRGVISNRQAKELGVGGEILCTVF